MPGEIEKLPDEIFQMVESFKKFIREQKAHNNSNQKFEVNPILDVEHDTEEFTLAYQRVSLDGFVVASLVRQLKDETTKLLSSNYFDEVADQFEARIKSYGELIKELQMSLDSITRTYNVDELFKWLKKQHETLGEIAAKIYMTHERILEKSEMDKFGARQV